MREAVYEMLTQQYEVARIQEAKEIPVVRVNDCARLSRKEIMSTAGAIGAVDDSLYCRGGGLPNSFAASAGCSETDPRKVADRLFHLRSQVLRSMRREEGMK